MKKRHLFSMIFIGILLFLSSCKRNWIINIDGYILHETNDKYYIAQIPESARNECIYEVPSKIGEYEISGFGSNRSLGIWAGEERLDLGYIRKLIINSNIEYVYFEVSNPLLIETKDPLSKISLDIWNYEDCYFLSPKEDLIPNYNYVDISNCYDGNIYEIKEDGYSKILFNYSNNFIIHNEFNNTIVNEIGHFAFSNSKLSEFVLPSNISIISSYAFTNSLLEKVTFNDNLRKIGAYAFENCRLSELVLPNVSLEIDDRAFKNNNIKEIIIPKNILSLGEGVFANNDIESFKFESENIDYISDGLFSSCPLTGELDFGDYIDYIGDNALFSNQREELIIPDTIEYFGDLSYCKNLKKIYFPNTPIRIGELNYLENLEELHLGGTTNLDTFEKMIQLKKLKVITVSSDNEHLYVKDGILYEKEWDRIIKCPSMLEIEKIEIYNQPYKFAFSNNVYIKEVYAKTLSESLFFYCINLEKVELDRINEIADRAFLGCKSLKEINLENVVRIGSEAFLTCESLNYVNLSKCKTVGYRAFKQCDLHEVVFTTKIEEIEDGAFENNKNLTKCNYYNAILGKNAFYDTPLDPEKEKNWFDIFNRY